MRTVLITLALLVGLAVPAQAEEPVGPSIAVPLVNADNTTATRVRIHAGPRTWRIKQTARWWGSHLPTLSVEIGPCVPDVPCVEVMVGRWTAEQQLALSQGQPGWWGLTIYPTPENPLLTKVLLDRSASRQWGIRRAIASHELGHVFGLDHDTHPDGIMCIPLGSTTCPQPAPPWFWQPNAAELAAVNSIYLP